MLTVDSFLCRWIVFALLAAGAAWGVTISLADDIVFPSEQWEETSPQSQSLDATKLAAAVDYLKQHSGRDGVREVVIVRNGRLVWKGDDIDKVHGIWSCTRLVDFDSDGDVDIFSGGGPLTVGEHVWFLWENADNKGGDWKEHVVQRGQRTHESVCADVDGDGDIDIFTKPWRGDLHLFVENLLKSSPPAPKP